MQDNPIQSKPDAGITGPQPEQYLGLQATRLDFHLGIQWHKPIYTLG